MRNIQYERVFNAICKRFNIFTDDNYTVDIEDGVCMHWYSFKEDVFCLTRDNHYIDKSGETINNFQKNTSYSRDKIVAEIYERMPDVYKVDADKEEAVECYLDTIHQFIDFYEEDYNELVGKLQ